MRYGKIEEGRVRYATFKNGALVTDEGMVWCAETEYPNYGYYPIKDVTEDGEPEIKDGWLMNYIGAPSPETIAKNEALEREMEIREQLENKEALYEALERLIAANGLTEADREMAAGRIALRDELGKAIQTDEGDGSMENPKAWKTGEEVETGKWYKTEGGYLWEALKSGVPQGELDREYFDVVGV